MPRKKELIYGALLASSIKQQVAFYAIHNGPKQWGYNGYGEHFNMHCSNSTRFYVIIVFSKNTWTSIAGVLIFPFQLNVSDLNVS